MKKTIIAIIVLLIFTSCIVSNSTINTDVNFKGGGVNIERDSIKNR